MLKIKQAKQYSEYKLVYPVYPCELLTSTSTVISVALGCLVVDNGFANLRQVVRVKAASRRGCRPAILWTRSAHNTKWVDDSGGGID